MGRRNKTKKPWKNIVEVFVGNEKFILTERDQNIVSKKSSYFSVVCAKNDNWLETNARKIELEDMTPKSFKQILRFFRYRKLDLRISNVQEFFKLADRFLYSDLRNYCQRYVESKMNEQNFLKLWSKMIQGNESNPRGHLPNVFELVGLDVLGEHSARFDQDYSLLEFVGVSFEVICVCATTNAHLTFDSEYDLISFIVEWTRSNIPQEAENAGNGGEHIRAGARYLLENAVDWSVLPWSLVQTLCISMHINDLWPDFAKVLGNFASILASFQGFFDEYLELPGILCLRHLKEHTQQFRNANTFPEIVELFDSYENDIVGLTKFTRAEEFVFRN